MLTRKIKRKQNRSSNCYKKHVGGHRRVLAMLHLGQIVLQVLMSSTSYRSSALLYY